MQQEQTTENIIDELIRECKIYRFASELNSTEDENRKTILRNILSILQRCDKETKEEKIELTQKKLNDIFDKEDAHALKKSWGRLNEIQKTNRIKNFVSKMIMDNTKKQQYENKLLELLGTKKLKKSQVEYDEKNGEITNIDIEV